MRCLLFLLCIGAAEVCAVAQPAKHLSDVTLMHEMRATPSPTDRSTVSGRFVSFQWPMPDELNVSDAALDGIAPRKLKIDKSALRYRLRYSTDSLFRKGVTEVESRWPFYNPPVELKDGVWFWQYGYEQGGQTVWKTVQQVTVKRTVDGFYPPAYQTFVRKLPKGHPRVWVDGKRLEQFRKQSVSHAERRWYLTAAEQILKKPMQTLDDININHAANLDNSVKRKALITRESRRIIDREEGNVTTLIYAYLLTADRRYADEALKRTLAMADWDKSNKVAGDFNEATLLSLCSMAYDSFYSLLTSEQKEALLYQIKQKGNSMYAHNNNHLENHIADNHVWQMTLRILSMAAYSTYGDLPEAALWAEYCYNVWLARFPGLNTDGGWHNGDSYFMVNARTLIEMPWFYGRITGYDFFSDPWYKGNILYTMYEQPPFSKSGGNGSSHQKILEPSGVRIGYLDALARLTGDTYAADFVRRTLSQSTGLLKKAFRGKSGDLAWFRLQCERPLPTGLGLSDLPSGHVFPESGLAAFHTSWDDYRTNAMLTFRSSPYGSTSHALANQNAFNTFYGGKPLFYSSGHHIQFTDKHSVYCHRATRAHNSVLVNGMGQRIGTEGYGWMPRYYTGDSINYVMGDASNAYGKVISPLWKERFRLSGLTDSPENGWDENHLKLFRRHIVTLGNSGIAFIYDELEADTAVSWTYLLHTVQQPMEVDVNDEAIHVRASNGVGVSDAFLYASDVLQTDTTSRFFVPADNWLRADDKGNFASYPNHWHFRAVSEKKTPSYRFATIVYTHSNDTQPLNPVRQTDGSLLIGAWTICVDLSTDGEASFSIRKSGEDTGVSYEADAPTEIRDHGKQVTEVDKVPHLEI